MLLQKEQVAETRVSLGMRHINTFQQKNGIRVWVLWELPKTHPASSSLPNKETQTTHCHFPGSFPQCHDYSFFHFKNCGEAWFLQTTFLIKPPYSVSFPCSQDHTLPHYGYFVSYVTMLSSSSGKVPLFYGTIFSNTAANSKNAHRQIQIIFPSATIKPK